MTHHALLHRLRELESDARRLGSLVDQARQEFETRGVIDDHLAAAMQYATTAAHGILAATVYLRLRATAPETNINNIADIGIAMRRDATAFPVCEQCGCEVYECACNAPEAA